MIRDLRLSTRPRRHCFPAHLPMARRTPRTIPCSRSTERVAAIATAFRAAGRLTDAEEVLVMAMALKSENDVLTAELRNDLAEVRRMLSTT